MVPPSKKQAELLAELKEEQRKVAELTHANEELKRRDALKDEFVSNVSHELRTSLASVNNVIANALAGVSGEIPEKFRQSLLLADENIKRFSNVLNDLLDTTRLEAGKIVLHRAEVDPVGTVTNAVASFEDEASKRGISLHCRWDMPPMFIFMDKDRIGQVIGNLLSNSLKFTPWGGSITVRGIACDANKHELKGAKLKALPEGSQVGIEVADTGCGIPPSRLEKVFDRLEQAKPKDETSGEEGLGLGLYISKQLIKLHGGDMWAQSPKEEGAIFTFTVPILGLEDMFRAAFGDRVHTAAIHHFPISLVLIDFSTSIEEKAHHSPRELEKVEHGLEAVIQKTLRRKSDTLWRRGGGRFGIILPHTTLDDSKHVARRVAEAMKDHSDDSSGIELPTAFRSAWSGFPEDGEDASELIALAESRL